jgi:two-component system, chemotaxis family, response regulator WspR
MPLFWTAIACAIVAIIYSLRLHQVTGRQRELARLVSERTAELQERSAQLEIANAALEELAAIDPMTGLFNRRRFDVFLQQEWQRSNRSRLPLSLLMIDIDYFKQFNDLYGHPAGDECIRQVVSVIRSAAKRVTDLGCRYGGEEFAIILAETPAAGALSVAEFIRKQVELLAIPHDLHPGKVVTVSTGIATKDGDRYPKMTDLIDACDKALYEAKNDGRNRTCTDVRGGKVAPAIVM